LVFYYFGSSIEHQNNNKEHNLFAAFLGNRHAAAWFELVIFNDLQQSLSYIKISKRPLKKGFADFLYKRGKSGRAA